MLDPGALFLLAMRMVRAIVRFTLVVAIINLALVVVFPVPLDIVSHAVVKSLPTLCAWFYIEFMRPMP